MSDKANNKDKIMDAAKDCFFKNGYINTSMNDIVRHAEVSKGSLYWHFKSKEEIFVIIIEQELDRWIDEVNEKLSKFDDPIVQIKEYTKLFFESIDQPVLRMYPQSYWGELGEHYLERINLTFHKEDDMVRDLFKEAVNQNLFKESNVEKLAWVYTSMIEGMFAKIALEYENEALLKKYSLSSINHYVDSLLK